MTNENLLSYDTLKSFCWAHGFHAEIHKNFNSSYQRPGREQAMWYLQRSKHQNPSGEHEPTLLKFALAQEVYDWILEYEKKEAESRNEAERVFTGRARRCLSAVGTYLSRSRQRWTVVR